MNFSRYKSEHVADHLRTAIGRGDFRDPLPSLRKWSSELDVSPGTLQAALKILKQEGFIGSHPRKGFYLARKPQRHPSHPPLVRMILHDPRHRSLPPSADIIVAISQKLAAHRIGFQLEYCDEARLRAVHKSGVRRDELLIFSNINLTYQRLFQGLSNVLMIGLPFPGVRLPFISSDIFSAIRHAVYRLQRHRCESIDLLHIIGRKIPESISRIEEEFGRIRANAARTFRGEVVWLSSERNEQCRAIQKLAARFRGDKQGLVVNTPIPPALLVMILKDRGLKIPEQVEILPVNCPSSQMVVYPPLEYYPYPTEQIAKAVSNAALHYFETGTLPQLEKSIALSLVSP